MLNNTFIAHHVQYKVITIAKKESGNTVLHTSLLQGAKVLVNTISAPKASSEDILKWAKDAACLIHHNPSNKIYKPDFPDYEPEQKPNNRTAFIRHIEYRKGKRQPE